MRIVVLNKLVNDLIIGTYEKHHKLEPIKIKDDIYILNLDAIIRIKSNLKYSKYKDLIKDNVVWFTVGDGSTLDVKYQQYLINSQAND